MDEKLFQRKLDELIQEVRSLPADQQKALNSLVDETVKRHNELKQAADSIRESVDFLRLSIKYILFDLEATRRENNYLKQMLDQSDNNKGD